MTVTALALVLAAAVVHALWNLIAKGAGGGPFFVGMYTSLPAILYAPLVLAAASLGHWRIGPAGVVFIIGSALIHLGYFLALQHGYRLGDLSLVYPLARGTGPILSTLFAIACFGERPSWLAIAGAVLIAVGVFLLTRPHVAPQVDVGQAVRFGLLTGVLIAAYTVWDKYAISVIGVPPLVMIWGTGLVLGILFVPAACRKPGEVRREWRAHGRAAIVIGVLSPLAYLLILMALAISPVSYVAPAREVSILIGTVLGTHLLEEGEAGRRLAAAAVMVLGVAALAVG